jgi:hypothetical protein
MVAPPAYEAEQRGSGGKNGSGRSKTYKSGNQPKGAAPVIG